MSIFFWLTAPVSSVQRQVLSLEPPNPQSSRFKSRLCITTLVFIQTFIGSSAPPTDCLTTTYRRRWNWNACGSGWTAACGGCRRESIYWRCHWHSELLWWLFLGTPSIHQLGFVIRWLCTLYHLQFVGIILSQTIPMLITFPLLPAACFAFGPSGQEKRVAVRWIDEKTLGAWMIPGSQDVGRSFTNLRGFVNMSTVNNCHKQIVNIYQLSINSP